MEVLSLEALKGLLRFWKRVSGKIDWSFTNEDAWIKLKKL